MKKIIVALFLITGTAFIQQAKAQISVNINIGNQPAWGPTGYDYVNYYYLPEVNCYYDISRSQFIYPRGNRWVYARNLPSRYRGVNLYNTYKVVVNRNKPYWNNQSDMRQYAQYKGNHGQPVIRDSRDNRYYASKQHPQHQQWVRDQKRGNKGTYAQKTNQNSDRGNSNRGRGNNYEKNDNNRERDNNRGHQGQQNQTDHRRR